MKDGEKKIYYCQECNKKVLKRQYSKQFEMFLCTDCLIDRMLEEENDS